MDQMAGRATPKRSTRRLAERAAGRMTRMQAPPRSRQRRAIAAIQAVRPEPARWQRILLGRGPRELAGVLIVTFAYFLTRGLVRGREADAFQHADELMALERILHLDWERP